MSALERNPDLPASTPDEDFGPSSDWRGIPRVPLQIAWRMDFPEATGAGPRGSHLNAIGDPIFLLELKKNQKILPSTRDEALFHCDVSREIPLSLMSLENVLDTLEATQMFTNIPISTSEEHRRSSHNSRRAPFFTPHLEMKVHFPASSGKESQHSSHTSGGGGLNVNLERNSSGCATIPKDPDVPIHSIYT